MIKYVKSHKPHSCRICDKMIPKGKILSLGFDWFCGWECWNDYEARSDYEAKRKEANQ